MRKNRNIPFGYSIVNGNITINLEEAAAVRQIFTLYIAGMSLKTIADQMTTPYIQGKNWNKNMVFRVLENQRYLGNDGCPRIVSDEEFHAAAELKVTRRTREPTKDTEPTQTPPPAHFTYEATDEIIRLTAEINRRINDPTKDRNTTSELILKCARLKYSVIKEAR